VAGRERFLRERADATGVPWTAFEARIRRCRLTADGPRDAAPYVLLRHTAGGEVGDGK